MEPPKIREGLFTFVIAAFVLCVNVAAIAFALGCFVGSK